jgi:hypothetical protein
VAGYTITITNDDTTGAETTIRVDTSTGGAVVTELTVRAADGGGLTPHQLPALDLEQLLGALAPATQPAITHRPAARTAAAAPTPEPEEVAAEAPTTRRRGAGTSTRSKTTARKTPAKKTTRSRLTKAEKSSAREAVNDRRAYRRMPEAEEVAAAYREAGSASGVAAHFDVPRHTASGWVRRLRSQGAI